MFVLIVIIPSRPLNSMHANKPEIGALKHPYLSLCRTSLNQVRNHAWVVVKGALNIRCRIIIGTQKGILILTTTRMLHVRSWKELGWNESEARGSREAGSFDLGFRV